MNYDKEFSGWYREEGDTQNHYSYVGTGSRLVRDVDSDEIILQGPGVQMSVTRGRTATPNFGVGRVHPDPDLPGFVYPPNAYEGGVRKYGTYSNAAEVKVTPGDITFDHPSTLFTEHPPIVDWLTANKGYGAKAITGIGIAANELGLPIADSSLSPHSAPITRKATERGYVSKNAMNPLSEATNNIPLSTVPVAEVPLSGQFAATKITSQEAREGWSRVRSIVGRNSTSPVSALPLSPIKNDVVRTSHALGTGYPDNDEERKPPTPVPGQLSLF